MAHHPICSCVFYGLTQPAPANLVRRHRAELPLWFDLLQDPFMEAWRTFHLRFQLTCCHLQTHTHTFKWTNAALHWQAKHHYIHVTGIYRFPNTVTVLMNVWWHSQDWGEVWIGWTPGWPHVRSSLTAEECLRLPETHTQVCYSSPFGLIN